MRAVAPPALQADKITWKSNHPVWIDQWPLPRHKLSAATQLVQEQLDAGHIEPSTSPWNTPIFVIQKKGGKWRLLQDLREINKTMVPMGALQPGLPSPVAIPAGYHKIVIDLKDCFFCIPLHPEDRKRFAFSLPVVNCIGPSPRFQWKVLPQGMANSPTLCQKFVAQAIDPFRLTHPDLYIVHYMDDILLAGSDIAILLDTSHKLVDALQDLGLQISPEKVQLQPPFLFLGFELHPSKVLSQKVELRKDSLQTLNDFQRLLGDINWLRPYLKLTTGDLKPLFDILRGDPDPSSPRTLTPEAASALNLVEKAILNQNISYYSPACALWLLILPTTFTPTGVLWQNKPLYWLHLPATPSKILPVYPSLIAQILKMGRESSLKLFNKDPDIIVVPYEAAQVKWLLQTSDEWAVNCISFQGKIDNHYPADKLIQFLKNQAVVFPSLTKSRPIPQAPSVFTDCSSSGIAAFSINGQLTKIRTDYLSAQLVELFAVVQIFKTLPNSPFNLFTDSAYISQSVPLLETVPFIRPSTNASPLFSELQNLILARSHPFFIGHIRAHSGLPGPLSTGNDLVDRASREVSNLVMAISSTDPIQQAQQAHQIHHLNARTLRLLFSITREQARQIVRQCQGCLTLLPEPHLGVNPRGLTPGELWQMDVTHFSPFGKLKYIHVSIDTFSGFLCATLQSGEATKHVISHMISCLAFLPLPKTLKTDNGPGYTSTSFKQFCAQLNIKHITGIPYNPQGQGIVERAHQTLKNMLTKLQHSKGILYPPHNNNKTLLNHALFVLNFLTLDNDGKSAADRFWHPTTANSYAQALWKDPLTSKWNGPDPVLIWGKGHACIYDSKTQNARWLPGRLIKLIDPPGELPPEKNV